VGRPAVSVGDVLAFRGLDANVTVTRVLGDRVYAETDDEVNLVYYPRMQALIAGDYEGTVAGKGIKEGIAAAKKAGWYWQGPPNNLTKLGKRKARNNGWMDDARNEGKATVQWKKVISDVWSWESPMQRRSGEGITAVLEKMGAWVVSVELPNGQVHTETLNIRLIKGKSGSPDPFATQRKALNMATETILQVLVKAVGG